MFICLIIFLEKYDYFTVMAFYKEDARILGYMGTHTRRDGDKAAHLGLHTLYTENGTSYYEEAELVLECKTIYKALMLLDVWTKKCGNSMKTLMPRHPLLSAKSP